MTGILASRASLRTWSQPVSTLGARIIPSTPCAMKARMAAIWFSCLPCASENFRSTPRLAASSLIDLLSATRQSLSAPTCAKPTVSFLPAFGLATVEASGVGADCLLQLVNASRDAAAKAKSVFFIMNGVFLASLGRSARKKALEKDEREKQSADRDTVPR